MTPGQERLRERCPIVALASKHPEAFDVTESKPRSYFYFRRRSSPRRSGAALHFTLQLPLSQRGKPLWAAAEPLSLSSNEHLCPLLSVKLVPRRLLVINLSEDWSRSFGASKQASADVTTVAPSLSKRPSVKPQASADRAAICSRRATFGLRARTVGKLPGRSPLTSGSGEAGLCLLPWRRVRTISLNGLYSLGLNQGWAMILPEGQILMNGSGGAGKYPPPPKCTANAC